MSGQQGAKKRPVRFFQSMLYGFYDAVDRALTHRDGFCFRLPKSLTYMIPVFCGGALMAEGKTFVGLAYETAGLLMLGADMVSNASGVFPEAGKNFYNHLREIKNVAGEMLRNPTSRKSILISAGGVGVIAGVYSSLVAFVFDKGFGWHEGFIALTGACAGAVLGAVLEYAVTKDRRYLAERNKEPNLPTPSGP